MSTAEPQAAEAFVSPLLLELFQEENRRNPYPLYHRFRSEHPVHFSPIGIWTMTRYDDVLAVLRDDRFSSDPRNATALEQFFPADADTPRPFEEMAGKVLLFTDSPDHTRMRNLVNQAFTRKTIENLRPHVQELVDGLIERVAEQDGMDVIADFAYPLPALVICELMGVPAEDRDRFKGLSADIAPILDPITSPEVLQKAISTVEIFIEYFIGQIEDRRKNPRDDLLTALAQAEEQGDQLSEEELLGLCVLVFVAGHETTQNLIGNGLLAMLRNRDQFDLLRHDPSLKRNAIEELLRYDSPVQLTGRSATTDIEVGGETIKKGQEVVVLIGAANRDPAVFAEPDRLDITRDKLQVMSFGGGMHFCLGAPLARLEGQIAFTALLDRFPKMELATEEPEWRNTLTLRGLRSLPVRF
jgi:pimeloyl-[acyl-carrier protein] synthase